MKKRIFKILMTLVITICTLFSINVFPAYASEPLDEIQNYIITVNMRPDGTMDIRYHVEWKVLDDKKEGPLSWVKIGNPNYHVDEIKALSDNIKDISYLSDNGSYIRIDFDREYEKNEIVSFDYTIHQSYMYVLEDNNNICRYSFTPGWFDSIEVKNIQIRWNATNVLDSTCTKNDDGYLVWEGSLGFGERLNASVRYNMDVFTVDHDKQYTEESNESSSDCKKIIIIIIAILVIVFIIAVIVAYIDDDYNNHSGFGGRSHTTYIHHSSCVRSSCACVHSCACACACAGGGRAGCSKKDFYKTNLKTEDLEKVLKN